MTHKLKIDEEYFDAVENGLKNFEIRYNDRNFEVGDTIILREITKNKEFTGREIKGRITYLSEFEQKEGYVVFSFKRV